MFEIAAVLGFNLERKLNWDMIHEYQPEILSIFPDKLAKSPLILDSVASCFPAGLPLIYSADRIQLYPRTQNAVKLGQIAAQLHKFEVQLDDQHTVYCYALTFYETAYVQHIETLAGKREKVLASQLELQLQSSKNPAKSNIPLNMHVKVYVQKCVVISCTEPDTGCEATLVYYINSLLNVEPYRMNGQWKKYVNSLREDEEPERKCLEELLHLTQAQLLEAGRLPFFEIHSLIEFLKTHTQQEKKPVKLSEDMQENACRGELKTLERVCKQEVDWALGNGVSSQLYHLNAMRWAIIKYPRVRGKWRATTSILKSSNVQDMRIKNQDFSFHYSDAKTNKLSKIFATTPNFPVIQNKSIFKH